MKVSIQRTINALGYGVFFYRQIEGQGSYVQQADGTEIFIKLHDFHADIKPTLQIDEHTARELMTALQGEGIRPKELTKVEGQYEAQGKHLEDLQNILRSTGLMK